MPGWTVWSHPSPRGETARQVSDRLDRVVARVRAQGGRCLMFGHGHATPRAHRALAGAAGRGGPVLQARHLDRLGARLRARDAGHPALELLNDANLSAWHSLLRVPAAPPRSRGTVPSSPAPSTAASSRSGARPPPTTTTFAELVRRAAELPTYLPWPMSPGWSVTDFGCVAGRRRTGAGDRHQHDRGPATLDGAVEVTVVSEEPGVGLGAGARARRTADPGDAVGQGRRVDPGARSTRTRAAVGARPAATTTTCSTGRCSPARPTAAGSGWCCGRPRRRCCCATTGSCADVSGLGPEADRAAVRRAPARLVRRPPVPGPRVGLCASTSTPTRSRSDGTRVAGRAGRGGRATHGLDVVALTDHDTAEGWQEAADAAVAGRASRWCAASRSAPVTTGAACTCSPTCPTRRTRRWPPSCSASSTAATSRLPGDAGAAARARHRHRRGRRTRRVAGGRRAIGRPHVADALVGAGRGRPTATRRSRPLPRPAAARRTCTATPPTLDDDDRRWCAAAGGVPRRRAPVGPARPPVLDRGRRSPACSERGLAGIEVDHQDHDAAAREAAARRSPRDLDLVVTGSSDYHGTGKVDHELGCNTTAPGAVRTAARWPPPRASGRDRPWSRR